MVARDKARVRTQMSAGLTRDDLDQVLRIFVLTRVGNAKVMFPKVRSERPQSIFCRYLPATIAYTVTCWAILTKIIPKAKVATTDFNIRFLRPCNTDVRCVARVIKAGRTMSLSEAVL